MRILDQVKEVVGGTTVFGQPYEKNGITVIPAATVWGGGGGGQDSSAEGAAGGGAGVQARPVGAFVVKGEDVSWVPAIDISRIVLMGQIVMIIAIVSWRSVAKARLRARRA